VIASDVPGPLPNLLVAGVAKAGTTSLFRYLAQHPDVCPSDLKELRYFSALFYGEPLGPLEEYRSHFAHCGRETRYRMEATPGYFSGGRPVAEAVNRLLPDVRVVVCFRNPVDRCWSWFRFQRSRGRVPKGMRFAEYLDRCEQQRREDADDTREGQPFWGMRGGCYDVWIDPWVEVFGKRLRVEFFEQLAGDPRGVVEGVCGWLGIDPAVCGNFRYDVENKTVQYKNKRLQQGAVALNRRGERFFAEHPRLKRSLRTAYYWVNSEDTEERMNPRDRARLEKFYAPHNERLATALAAAGLAAAPDWLGLAPPGVARARP
jgi:sulfotransferase family protein